MQLQAPAKAVIVLLVTLIWIPACRKAGITQENRKPTDLDLPTVVVVYPVQGEVKQSLKLPGTLKPYEKAAVFAKVSGFLEKVHVDIGDVVKKGDVLAQLIVPELQSELKHAEAEVVKNKAIAGLADITYKRLSDLRTLEPGAVAQQDVDLATAQVEVARAEVLVSEAKVSGFQTLLSYTTIRAPFDGTVKRRLVDTGVLISAGAAKSEPIVEIVRTDRLRLVFYVPESIAPHVKQGQKVRFTCDAFPGKSFERSVSRLAGALMEDTRSMRVESDIDSTVNKFSPGMYATVYLAFRDIPDALTIPAAAVHIINSQSHVCTAVDGVIHWVPVTILQDDGAQDVIASELQPETAVVVAGPTYLEEGQMVQRRKEGAAE